MQPPFAAVLTARPAFFAIARELRPITVGMTRKEIKKPRDGVTGAFYEISHEVRRDSLIRSIITDTKLELWGCNSSLEAKTVKVQLDSWLLGEGQVDQRDFTVSLDPNSSTEIWKGTVPGAYRETG
jgi:beta-mannosidase